MVYYLGDSKGFTGYLVSEKLKFYRVGKGEIMPKTGALILGILILLLSTTDVSAERMDMVKLKDRSAATLYAALSPTIPAGGNSFQGYGQIYNGQYLKAGGFFLNVIIGGNIFVASIYD